MKALKICAYQSFACYRKPLSFGFIDTYPLPPFSTVKGWFHHIIDADQYIPISMSIHGCFSSVVYDMQTMIKFDRKRGEREQIILEGFNKAFNKSPTFVANIFDINLTIYMRTEEKSLEKFRKKLMKKEYPHLGRYEDLMRIDFINYVELFPKSFGRRNPYTIFKGTYIKEETAKKHGLSGVNYRLNFKYEIKNGIRHFEKVDIVYIDNGTLKGEWLFDESENLCIEFIGDYGG